MMQRRDFLGTGLALAAGSALAQSNTKIARIVVPFAPGGVQDLLARAMSTELGLALGQTVIIENRPGAGGTVGTGYVAKSAPDSGTMVLGAASHNIAGSLYTKLSYDPQKDFAPMAHIGTADYVLMIHPDVPAKTAAEYIRYAKANPGKLNYATAGIGSATHLSMAYFNGLAGIDVVHVPLKATGEAINEVISGRAQAVIAASIGALAFARDSRIRLIGVTSPKRSKYLPEVPTIAESGLPGYQFDSWFGLLGPAATPAAEVNRVNAAMAKVLKDPVVLERLDKQGIEPLAMNNADFAKLLAVDYKRMAEVVKASGAKVE
ncbi:tripartite tricarboxylate transporter substrate binding protein [Polaromonas sp. JS666]|uniref:tripartite tricarboxylate transporter substrate binding protein n=1 Tax=Polaromonas sp. (strain JS666 / ATCC BAA-500) TaxID=296591 RepID=UPI0008830A83|nr:tripartite tricarboxylate transporter substrate binding protein [Polaromonas sp. JS666]SDN26948.1 Tripartite-type tricarboxylate transporter, receptor component TctC [Polaromonas sp. JS666]